MERNAAIVREACDGKTLQAIAADYGISRGRVTQIVQRALPMGREDVDFMREQRAFSRLAARADRYLPFYEAGLTHLEIAARFGLSNAAICYALNAHPNYRPRRKPRPPGKGVSTVPSWVPAEHRARYERIASSNGEEVAAGCIRRLKRLEAAQC